MESFTLGLVTQTSVGAGSIDMMAKGMSMEYGQDDQSGGIENVETRGREENPMGHSTGQGKEMLRAQ